MKKKKLFIIMMLAIIICTGGFSQSVSAEIRIPTETLVSPKLPTWKDIKKQLRKANEAANKAAKSKNTSSTVAKYVQSSEDKEKASALNDAVEDFEKSIVGTVTNFMFGFAILTSLLCFVIVVLKFGASGANPNSRNTAMADLGICVLCIALLGSVKLLTSLIIGIAI
jgi:hypothetical protein